MDAPAPSSLESLRQANRLRVMALLQQRGRASRADIVRASGLSRTTVSTLVAELLHEGLVVERLDLGRQIPSPEGGRPATLLTLDPASGAFLGIDFAHDSLRMVLVDRSGELLADGFRESDVSHHPKTALALTDEMAASLMERAGLDRDRLRGVGAAISAPLRVGGHVTFASQRIFPGWGDLDLERLLSERFACTVQFGNDANLGALAEATFGAGRGVENLLYVMLSTGVGLGLWLRGQLYVGDTGTAGEFGHVVVDPGGHVCRCGNRGCLETVAGLGALAQALRYVRGGQVSSAELLELARQGDPGTTRVLTDAGEAVGHALVGLCSVLDPALIILGGELAAAGRALLETVQATLERETSPAAGRGYPVHAGALGARAEALGAAALAMDSQSRQMLAGNMRALL